MERLGTEGGARADAARTVSSITQGEAVDEAEAITRVADRLRGPLTAVLAYSQVLEQGGTRMPEERLADLHERLATSARELAGLLEDVLHVDLLDEEAS